MNSNKEEMINFLQTLTINNKRRIWKPAMEKYGFNTICELGVRDGANFLRMIEHNPQLAVAVDCWIDDGVLAHNDAAFTQEGLTTQYENFKAKMADKSFVKIFKGYTTDVVKQFDDNFFDLVYIDADHTYTACLRDIRDWYPKVKSGGILSGDDYTKHTTKLGIKFGVIEAVQQFIKENNLEEQFFYFPRNGWGIIKPL